MKCGICGKKVCNHASFTLKGYVQTCSSCGKQTNLKNGDSLVPCCLPMENGEMDLTSEVFTAVCDECHDEHSCTCPKECDCENPPPDNWDGKSGVFHVSNLCPKHNFQPPPFPADDCPVHAG